MKKTQTFINENIPSFLHHKRKGESLPFLSSSSNIPKISKETLDQIEYLINKKMTPPSLSLDNSKLRSYLSSLSIREKYEDLLTRKSLLLPPKYKMLLKKQTFLDFILSNDNSLKSKFTYIKEQFTKECSIPFTIDDFEKILFIAPFYYIYQAKKKIDDTTELVCIDLPKDYAERTPAKFRNLENLSRLYTEYQPFRGNVNTAVLEKRKEFFKKVLVDITKKQHEEFLERNKLPHFDPDKNLTWHHLFNLSTVKDIGNLKLIENNIKEKKKLKIR